MPMNDDKQTKRTESKTVYCSPIRTERLDLVFRFMYEERQKRHNFVNIIRKSKRDGCIEFDVAPSEKSGKRKNAGRLRESHKKTIRIYSLD